MTEMSPGVKRLLEWSVDACERLDRVERTFEDWRASNPPNGFGRGQNDWSANRAVDPVDSDPSAYADRFNDIDQRIDCLDLRLDQLDKLVRRLLEKLEQNPLDRVIALDRLDKSR